MKTVLLTGATGLIGKEVGKILTEKNYAVIAVARSKKKAREELPFQVAEIIEWDGKGEFPTEVMNRVDAVINLMGENLSDHRWTDEVKARLVSTRVETSHALVRAAKNSKTLSTWIQGSAIGIYGETKPAQVADETTASGTGFLAALCVNWENAIDSLAPSIRKVCLRTGVVFSHKAGAFEKLVFPMLNGIGGVLGSGEQMMSIVHLQDEVNFIVHALETAEAKGAFNLVCTQPICQKELVEQIAKELHTKLGPRVPAFALKIAMGEMASILLDSQAVMSKRLAEVGFKLKFQTPSDIVKEVSSWHQNPIEPEKAAFIQVGEQFVPRPRAEIIQFFEDAKNLETLTPPWLNFKIESVSTPQMEKNTQIRYNLKIHGVPASWVTDIAVWNPPEVFVDNQLSGPYSLWYHEHRFEEVKGGVLVKDWIRYRLPLGKLGQWVGITKVKSDVEAIFKFRKEKIVELFSETK
jgi:uncharacterized protein (TIGR01777 family)